MFVKDGKVTKVQYYQHAGHYTRRRGTFDIKGERPVVYIGKVAHGSYHNGCNGRCSFSEFFSKGCLGSVDYCQGGCGYWDDFRNNNNGITISRARIYDLQPGANIDGIDRPDREICSQPECKGSRSRILTTAGCWQNNP